VVSDGRVGFNPSVRSAAVAFFPQPALEKPSAVTEVGDMAVDKRKALQPVLDSIEKRWQIVKPSPLTPDNLETECIF
jgi:hypothetical protein